MGGRRERSPAKRRQSGPDRDRLGFDTTRSSLASAVGTLVPKGIANRMVDISVDVEQRTVEMCEPVRFTVTIRNRLPVPVVVETTEARPWGWTVDGLLEAREDGGVGGDDWNSLALRSRERKRITREWNGRFRRTEAGRTRWLPAEPGTHELSVFLTTPPRPSDTVEVVVRA